MKRVKYFDSKAEAERFARGCALRNQNHVVTVHELLYCPYGKFKVVYGRGQR